MNVLDGSIGFLLARTARSMKRALEARLSAYNITASQYVVLSVLDEQDGISLSQLGQLLYFDNPTITGIMDRMERDGLVERRRIADDRRVINIFLTGQGRELLKEIEPIAEAMNQEALIDFSPKQKADFVKKLNIVWKNVNGKID
jgi:DNA-binding MarR family transcriptional regulator